MFLKYAQILYLNNIILLGYEKTGVNETLGNSLYENSYSEDDRMEIFWLGLVSLALTIVNIICIIGTGWLILRIKEVTPQKIPQKFSSFWTQDVKVHRDYLKKWDENANQTLLDEAHEALGIGKTLDSGLEKTFLQTMFDKVEQDPDYLNITKWGEEPKPISSSKRSLKRQSKMEVPNDPAEITEDTKYIKHQRSQSLRHKALDKRLHNQGNMMVRQSMQPSTIDIQNEDMRPRTVTFSGIVDGDRKRGRALSMSPNGNNPPSALKKGSKGSTSFTTLQEIQEKTN